jgi:hypothetical protein
VKSRWTVLGPGRDVNTPVVPCDDEAVERGARALAAADDRAWGGTGGYESDPAGYREFAEVVLRAAGEMS